MELKVLVLKSVNGLSFGSSREESRNVFGTDYEEFPRNVEESEEDKAFFDEITKELAEMSGESVEDFLSDIPDDDEDIFDDYNGIQICFDRNLCFEAVQIPKACKTSLIVDGKDCSSFKLDDFFSLAEDFVWEPENTSWTSHTKQIGIYCPENEKKVECVLFGRTGYYDEENKIPSE